jgi:hypothetical protein
MLCLRDSLAGQVQDDVVHTVITLQFSLKKDCYYSKDRGTLLLL